MGSSHGTTTLRFLQTLFRLNTNLLSRSQFLITQFLTRLARFWLIQMLNASPLNSKPPPSKLTRFSNNRHRLKSGNSKHNSKMCYIQSHRLHGCRNSSKLVVIPQNLLILKNNKLQNMKYTIKLRSSVKLRRKLQSKLKK